MKKLIATSLLPLTISFIGDAFAASETIPHETQYIFLDSAAGSYNTDMDFPPGIPQTFSNPLFWTVNAQCTVQTIEPSSPVRVKAIKGKGQVNGAELTSKMDPVLFTVKNNDILLISADGGAVVELINMSKETIKAHCSI